MKHSLLILALIFSSAVMAEETVTLNLIIKDGKFNPSEFKVPSNSRIEVMIENLGPGAEEFESKDLKREKVIPQGQKVKVTLGILKKGTYKFFGEYHEETAKGKIIAE